MRRRPRPRPSVGKGSEGVARGTRNATNSIAQRSALRDRRSMTVSVPRGSSEPRARTPGAPRHLETIRFAVGSDRAISEIVGVSPSQITRWRRGQEPDPENADRLAALALVIEMLTRIVHVDVIEEWLTGANAHLAGRTPTYLLRRGRLAEVIGAVEALKAGTFA